MVRYDISHGGEGHFAVNNVNGAITTLLILNREIEDIFEFTVVAYDTSAIALVSHAQVTISVQDVNDNSPIFEFSDYHCNATEELNNELVACGVLIRANDADIAANAVITYIIVASEFTVATASNIAIVSTGMALDSDVTSHYAILLFAEDAGSPVLTGTTTLHITLIDSNDKTPTFDNSLYTATLPEDTPGGTKILTVSFHIWI